MASEIDFGKPLQPSAEPQFAELCRDTQTGFSDALDLVLIHNEQEVRGNQPRSTLNPLTVLLAVAAWERFLVDLRAVALGKWTEPGLFGKRQAEKLHQPAWLGTFEDSAKPGNAQKLLSALTGDRLPEAWLVRTFAGWTGKSPQGPSVLGGSDAARLAQEVDAGIMLRNAIAHRAMAQDKEVGPYRESDAEKSHTVQAGWARTVLGVFLQLTDQAIVATAHEAGFESEQYRLPAAWFAAEPSKLRGVETPGVLWGGYELVRD